MRVGSVKTTLLDEGLCAGERRNAHSVRDAGLVSAAVNASGSTSAENTVHISRFMHKTEGH